MKGSTEMCEIWDYGQFVYVLKFDFPLPEDYRANILVSAEDRSWVGGLSDGQEEQGRIVLPQGQGRTPHSRQV